MAWTLTIGSTTKSLADWGVSGLTRRRSSQALDVVGFVCDGLDVDADAPFSAGSEVAISRDSVVWFRGRITGLRREAFGVAERISYEVAGPWWYMERLVYQQTWQVYGVGPVYRSHCLLNTFADGNAMHTRDQIDEALEWSRSRAFATYGTSPFQWDKSGFPLAYIPADEVRDITVAECVRKQLRWVPDAVSWFDYSTTPPTFHCKRRADLTSVDVAAGAPVSVLQLVPRYDLQVPSVVLKFESTDTVDGVSYTTITRQNAPVGATGEEFGALCATIDLQGTSISSTSAAIEVMGLPTTEAGWLDWLKLKHPTLDSDRIASITVTEFSRFPTEVPANPTFANELLEGQVADWMPGQAQEETVLLRVSYTVENAAGTANAEVRDEEFAVNITTTNLTTGTYTSIGEIIVGESPPTGLAAFLYAGLSVLEWEGAITLTGESVAGSIGIGNAINITGGRAEWASMNAVVQEIEEDVDSGTVRISVGPPQHLGPRDLVELLRVGRFRRVITPPALRNSGVAPGGGNAVTVGRRFPRENAVGGPVDRSLFAVGTIVLDVNDADGADIRIREIDVCVDGVQKKMLVLCSEPY